MKASLKTRIFKCLDVLPTRMGYLLYHALQNITYHKLPLKKRVQAGMNSYLEIEGLLKSNNIDIRDQEILEIGSGWLPILPIIFKKQARVKHIHTYDINEHYTKKRIAELRTCMNISGVDLRSKTEDKMGLPDFISYYPNTNITYTQLPEEICLVYSRFVLEHVYPNDLLEMHRALYDQLKSGAIIIHLISSSDHRAYSDSSLSYYDFLQYSTEEWNQIQTKFDYHNRLRLPEYLDVFKKTGFEVLQVDFDEVDPSTRKYQMYKSLKIHEEFQLFNEEELLAGAINVLLRKP